MKKMTKILCLLLSAAMLTATLAACGGNDNTSTTGSNGTTTAPGTGNVTEPVAPGVVDHE